MEKEFKLKRTFIIFNVLMYSTFTLIILIGIILEITQDNIDYVMFGFGLLAILVFGLMLYDILFRRVRVICAKDAFIVYRGKNQIVKIDHYKAEFRYDISKHRRGIHCKLIIIKYSGITKHVHLDEIGLPQFKEICEILHMKKKLNLQQSKSEWKYFKIE